MPPFQTTLTRGIVESPLNALTDGGANNSLIYGLPQMKGTDGKRTVTWQSIPAGGPSAISLKLQGALRDVDAEYGDLDSSTNTAGEIKVVDTANVKFLRVRQVSRTGGTSTTVLLSLT